MNPLDYFYQDQLNQTLFSKMANLQGWHPRINDPGGNYDYLMALMTGAKPAIQWEDMSPKVGAQWHWPSKTEGGNWLKAETHPTHWMEEDAEMKNDLFKLLGNY